MGLGSLGEGAQGINQLAQQLAKQPGEKLSATGAGMIQKNSEIVNTASEDKRLLQPLLADSSFLGVSI